MVRYSILVYKFHVVVHSPSHDRIFVTPWSAACQASLSLTISWSLFTHVHWVGEAIQTSRPLPHSSPAFNLSKPQGIFQWVTKCIRWPNYWSFSISPSNEYSGLSSFRIDWFDLLAVQGTVKSLLQHHSPKASILRCSAFFTVQLSHPYMTTEKTIALTRQTIVGKIMPLLFCCCCVLFFKIFI